MHVHSWQLSCARPQMRERKGGRNKRGRWCICTICSARLVPGVVKATPLASLCPLFSRTLWAALNADAGIKPRASGWEWEEGNGFSVHMQILSIFPAADWPFEANLQAKSRPNKAIGPNNPIKPLFLCGHCLLKENLIFFAGAAV